MRRVERPIKLAVIGLGGAVVLADDIPHYDVAEFRKKAKCIRNSEMLAAGSLCNQYNPECNRKSAIRKPVYESATIFVAWEHIYSGELSCQNKGMA